MNHGTSHLVWMGVVFTVLLVVGKIVGVSPVPLFLLFCFFMIASMMLGMDNSNHDDHKHKH